MSERRDDPEVVLAAQRGDQDAFTLLFRRWFDPCVDVARRIVHDEGTAAEVAQESFLVAWRQLDTLRDPAAFGGWVLRTTRNKALNRLERERRSVAVDQDDDPVLSRLEAVDDVAADVTVAEQQELLWAASAALGERDASVLDLHLRHGLDAAEIGEELGVTTNNAHQVLFRMKGRLAGAIRAWVLYKGGDPACDELGRVLRQAGITSFSAEAVKVIDRHARGCDECTRRRAALLAPEAMFAAVPVLPVGLLLRERAAAGLRADGVPLGPEAAQPLPDGTGQGSSTTGSGAGGAEQGLPPTSPSSAGGGPPAPGRARRGVLLAVAAVVALVVVVGLSLVAFGSDDAELAVDAETTTTGSSASTTAPPDTTGPSLAPPPETGLDPTTTSVPPPDTTGTTAGVPVPPGPPEPPPPPAPEVTSFTATAASSSAAFCGPGQWPFSLSWTTVGADTVEMTPAGGSPVQGGPSGATRGCAPTAGSTWTLVATGPGGTASATSSPPAQPPAGGPGGLRG